VDELIVKALMRSLSAAEERAFAAWRMAEPANEARYRALAEAWGLITDAFTTETLPAAPTASAIIARAGIRVLPGLKTRNQRLGPRTQILVAVAAMAAAVVLWAPWSARLAPSSALLGATEFATGAGESSVIQLNDGTIVRLGPSSHLRFVDSVPNRRTVLFGGRGFFAVAKDSLRPFVVRTTAGTAEVLGTQFEIESDAAAMKVLVVEGRVAVSVPSGRREVAANQQATTANGSPLAVSAVPNRSPRPDWIGDLLVFQEEPLVKVIETLERRFGVSIELRDPAIGHRAVTAWIQEADFRVVLDVICRVVAARCTSTKGAAVIYGSEGVPEN